MYKTRRKLLSQNFLFNRNLVKKLLRSSSIGKNDLVIEIGPGGGIITKELVKRCGKVLAIELDLKFFKYLTNVFKNTPNIQVFHKDFFNSSLPLKPYKVFSNIPFKSSAGIVRKLLQSANPPEDMYLVVQKEFAEKYVGVPFANKNSLLSILLKPYFEFSIVHHFQRTDFAPQPMVEVVMLRTQQRQVPLINANEKNLFEDFIAYSFSQTKPNILQGLSNIINKGQIKVLTTTHKFSPTSKPSELRLVHWIALFEYFSRTSSNNRQTVSGTYNRLLSLQKKLKRIHRTREDRNWKNAQGS